MRWMLSMLVLLFSCEANAPTFAPLDAGADAVDPYGDSCECPSPTMEDKCRANGNAPLNGKCLLYASASLDCNKVKACYSTKHATCVSCVQP